MENKITKNFYYNEFYSKDGAETPLFVLANLKLLASNLQVIREAIDAPIHINSGYRSPSHNENIGGVKNSYHTRGMAADIVSKNLTARQLSKVIQKLMYEGKITKGGIGLYNGFVHYDTRGYNARWDNSSRYNFARFREFIRTNIIYK